MGELLNRSEQRALDARWGGFRAGRIKLDHSCCVRAEAALARGADANRISHCNITIRVAGVAACGSRGNRNRAVEDVEVVATLEGWVRRAALPGTKWINQQRCGAGRSRGSIGAAENSDRRRIAVAV